MSKNVAHQKVNQNNFDFITKMIRLNGYDSPYAVCMNGASYDSGEIRINTPHFYFMDNTKNPSFVFCIKIPTHLDCKKKEFFTIIPTMSTYSDWEYVKEAKDYLMRWFQFSPDLEIEDNINLFVCDCMQELFAEIKKSSDSVRCNQFEEEFGIMA